MDNDGHSGANYEKIRITAWLGGIKLSHAIASRMAVAVRRTLMAGSLIVVMISSLLALEISIAGEVTAINNIKEWKHPVKDVLLKHNIVIYKVEIYNKTYPVFYVKFPYDPWLGHNDKFFKPLYYETLQANGFWDYSFVDRSSQCKINIKWDKPSKTLTESLEDLK
jgi:hypothetical protein